MVNDFWLPTFRSKPREATGIASLHLEATEAMESKPMLIIIEERTRDDRGVVYHRPIASWTLPDTEEVSELTFTQLATADSRKVATYRITIVPGSKHG